MALLASMRRLSARAYGVVRCLLVNAAHDYIIIVVDIIRKMMMTMMVDIIRKRLQEEEQQMRIPDKERGRKKRKKDITQGTSPKTLASAVV